MHKLKVGDRIRVINNRLYQGLCGVIVKRVTKGKNLPHDYYLIQLDADACYTGNSRVYVRSVNCVNIVPFVVWNGR